jgi:hypothetical protein
MKGGFKSTAFFTMATWGMHYVPGRLQLNYFHDTQGRNYAVDIAEAKLEGYGNNVLMDLAFFGWDQAALDYLESQNIYKSR